MRQLHPNTSTKALLGPAKWHEKALDQFAQTRPLVEGFRFVVEAMVAAAAQVEEAEDALLGPRMQLALAELDGDALLRKLAGACQLVDGVKKGATFEILYPEGLTPVVQVVSARQVAAINSLLDRARGRELLGHPILGPLLTELEAVAGRMTEALESRKAAYSALAQARSTERMAREELCTTYSRDAGIIQSIFPRDRARREFFFENDTRSSASPPADEAEADANE